MSQVIGYYYPQTAEFRRTRRDKGRKRGKRMRERILGKTRAGQLTRAAGVTGAGAVGIGAALLLRKKAAKAAKAGSAIGGKGGSLIPSPGGATTLHAQELRPRFRKRAGGIATVGTSGAIKLYEDQVLRPYNRPGAPYRTGRLSGSSPRGLLRGGRPGLPEGSLTSPGRSPNPYRSGERRRPGLPSPLFKKGPNSTRYRKPKSPGGNSPPVSRKKRGYSK